MQTLHSFFLPYITSNRQEFITQLSALSDWLICDINDLVAAMYRESLISANSVNASTGATGLIQIMPLTAIQLGTTTEALKQMSNVEQLKYVKLYLAPYRGSLNSFKDIYLSIFYPAAVGKSNTWKFPDIVHDYNTGIDLNTDGNLTVGEFEQWALKTFPPDLQKLLKKKSCNTP